MTWGQEWGAAWALTLADPQREPRGAVAPPGGAGEPPALPLGHSAQRDWALVGLSEGPQGFSAALWQLSVQD